MRKFQIAAVILSACLLSPAAESSDAARKPKVLVIYSYHDELPWQHSLREGFMETLNRFPGSARPEVYEERLDAARLGEASLEGFAVYLAQRYAGNQPDIVVSESSNAARLLLAQPELFPGAQRMFFNHGQSAWNELNGSGYAFNSDIRAAILAVPEVLPNLERLVFIMDDTLRGKAWQSAIREIMERQDRLEWELWYTLSYDEIITNAGALRGNAALFYLPVLEDRERQKRIPKDVAAAVAKSAKVPVFVHHDTFLDTGTLGGYVLSSRAIGAFMAEAITEWRNASSQPKPENAGFEFVYDENALRRFRIPADSLPDGARLINQRETVAEQYRLQIMGILALVALESMLILALAKALRGRKAALNLLQRERNELEEKVLSRTSELRVANENLAVLATTDHLTGIANRRCFLDEIESELERFRRSGRGFALIMFDIDHFKLVNDSYGHETGDTVLVGVVGTAKHTLRSVDLLARYGGEEFMVLLPDTDGSGAGSIAERLRIRIADQRFRAGDTDFSVTISLGCIAVTDRQEGITLSTLLQKADTALYQAKEAGRNRLVMG